ncbi:MAG: hypothetical protein ACP6IU_06710 [Candidatus Asgardarchaeia archaeon]
MSLDLVRKLISHEDKQKLKEARDILEGLVETLDLLLDEESIKKLQKAEEDIKEGRLTKWEDFLKELRSM